MRIFLDANILVTVLCNEYPRFTYCSRVLSGKEKRAQSGEKKDNPAEREDKNRSSG